MEDHLRFDVVEQGHQVGVDDVGHITRRRRGILVDGRVVLDDEYARERTAIVLAVCEHSLVFYTLALQTRRIVEATEVGDRAEAILRAVDGLEPGDAALICGKGHETGQIIGTDVYPFDDAEQASVAVAALDGDQS